MNTTGAPLTDKVALITGGARRLGAHIARVLHNEGMNLLLHYRTSVTEARGLQEELNAKRAESVLLVGSDLLNLAKLDRLVDQATESFGRLDVLVNNASSFYATPIGATTEEQWTDLIGTNLKAPFFLAQAAARALGESQGCVINLIDIYADRPLRGHSVYSLAKAGLAALTRSLAIELGPHVRVNGIAPGAVLWPENDTNQIAQQRLISNTPLKRIGQLDDISSALLYLVRDAPFVSGQILNVDGGRSVVS